MTKRKDTRGETWSTKSINLYFMHIKAGTLKNSGLEESTESKLVRPKENI